MKIIASVFILIFICGCNSGITKSGRTGHASPAAKVLTTEEKKHLATTTLYYVEQFSEADVNNCAETDKKNLLTRKNQLLVRVCKKVFDSCLMEGTCLVSIKNKIAMLNVDGLLNGIRRFRDITGNECKYGRGASSDSKKMYKSMCVDPFYSVAADLKIYNLGDVIYLPAVRGVVLPNGEIHDGYFIVRDAGGGIEGEGRFDFFTGLYTSSTLNNPFTKLKLNGLQTFPEYVLIEGAEADQMRQQRNFPLLPLKK